MDIVSLSLLNFFAIFISFSGKQRNCAHFAYTFERVSFYSAIDTQCHGSSELLDLVFAFTSRASLLIPREIISSNIELYSRKPRSLLTLWQRSVSCASQISILFTFLLLTSLTATHVPLPLLHHIFSHQQLN